MFIVLAILHITLSAIFLFIILLFASVHFSVPSFKKNTVAFFDARTCCVFAYLAFVSSCCSQCIRQSIITISFDKEIEITNLYGYIYKK